MFRLLIATLFLASAALISGGAAGASAGGGCHSETLTDGRGVAVDLAGNCFEPAVIRIDAGQTITWTNQDEAAHTVTGVTQTFGDYEEVAGGESVSYNFADPGVFPYFCVLHPSMVGAVVVGDGAADSAAAAAAGARGGGESAASIAGIATAVGLGAAAVGLAGSRMLSRRRAGDAAV